MEHKCKHKIIGKKNYMKEMLIFETSLKKCLGLNTRNYFKFIDVEILRSKIFLVFQLIYFRLYVMSCIFSNHMSSRISLNRSL